MKPRLVVSFVRSTSLRAALFGVCAASCFAGVSCAQAQKIGTVDMNKVFSGYYKTKDAESRINEAREVAKKELNDRMDSHKGLLDEINTINKQLDSPALSKQAKDDLAKKRDDKIAQVRDLEREINEFKGSREKQLQEQAVRMRNTIVEEIMKVVQDKVKSENFEMVFDKSGQSLNGVQIVLYSKDSMDFSDDVVTALNKTKPATPAAAPALAAPAPAAKPSPAASPRR